MTKLIAFVFAFTALLSTASFAQSVTATCKDGTSYSGEQRSGACARHGGVRAWGSDAAGAATPTPAPGPTATQPAPKTAAPAPTSSPTTATTPSRSPAGAPSAGQVWVNTKTNVYHCAGTRWYGATKAGNYMTEDAAKAAGARADHGKACS